MYLASHLILLLPGASSKKCLLQNDHNLFGPTVPHNDHAVRPYDTNWKQNHYASAHQQQKHHHHYPTIPTFQKVVTHPVPMLYPNPNDNALKDSKMETLCLACPNTQHSPASLSTTQLTNTIPILILWISISQ